MKDNDLPENVQKFLDDMARTTIELPQKEIDLTKADMMTYGTGACFISESGSVSHIPFNKLFLPTDKNKNRT